MSCVYSTRWDKMKNFIQDEKLNSGKKRSADKYIYYALIKKFYENLNAWVESYMVYEKKVILY